MTVRRSQMVEMNILKTDARGRISLPPPFRSEPLFEYVIEGDQLILYPVRTVRKYPDMSALPAEELSSDWVRQEMKINRDTRRGIAADTASEALKLLKK